MSETAWSYSNGGFSTAFIKPSYQNGFHNQAYRGVPDLSANADPGYLMCISANNCQTIRGKLRFSNMVFKHTYN